MEYAEKNRTIDGMLYLVATPIGNLSDLSPRALKVLEEVDFIAAEDTRNSLHLLTHFGLRRPLVSYHEHNKNKRGPEIVARLLAGESCALITDAGMPAVSDPGEDLVRLCAEAGIAVTCIPGCNAVLTALALSALSSRRFCFEGFLPVPNTERRERLDALKQERRTTVLYEAPHRLIDTLQDLRDTLGGARKISLCRELTKRNEEIRRTTLDDAIAACSAQSPRGEYVLVLEGADEAGLPLPEQREDGAALCSLSPEEHVRHYTDAGLERMAAIKAAARDRGMSKSQFYRLIAKD